MIRRITALLSLVVFLVVFVGKLGAEAPNSGDLYPSFQWAVYAFLSILLLGLAGDYLITLKTFRKRPQDPEE